MSRKLPKQKDWLDMNRIIIHSMIGCITTNFRQISLLYDQDTWFLNVVIENADEEDIDLATSIEHYASNFISEPGECFNDVITKSPIKVKIIDFSGLPLPNPDFTIERLLFRMHSKGQS